MAGPGIAGGEAILVGAGIDADGKPVPDAMIEIWQANSHGKYAPPEDNQNKPLEPGFQGYGRIPHDVGRRI